MSVISTRIQGDVLVVTSDNPPVNALGAAVRQGLADAMQQAASDDAVKAVVIRCDGRTFFAGADITEFGKPPRGASLQDVIIMMDSSDKPIVAAVQGLAVGVGTTLLFHCDLVYAAPDARFIMPFVNLGLVPEAGSSLLAPATLGHAKAAAMLLLGEPMDAQAADRAGLLTAIVPAETLIDHARAKALALTTKPPQALAHTRRLMKGDPAILAARIEQEAVIFRQTLASAEAREAFTAFLEKRPPVFQRG